MKNKEAFEEAGKLMEMVGIRADRIKDFPHQFSGGMRQRIGIAAALACNPELLIADEPTTALDVTIQAQILELIKELEKKFDTSLLMITHNLGIILSCAAMWRLCTPARLSSMVLSKRCLKSLFIHTRRDCWARFPRWMTIRKG